MDTREPDANKAADLEVEDRNYLELTRREMIMRSGGAAAALSLIGVGAAAEEASPSGAAPLFFSPDEFAMVEQLTEIIIPADAHSPGAKAARVATYIDFTLSEHLDDKVKSRWREGLKLIDAISEEMNGSAFMKSTAEQQVAVMTRISQHEMKPEKAEQEFFAELKSRTVHAYYTSEIGIKQEIEYKGNRYLKEFVGYEGS